MLVTLEPGADAQAIQCALVERGLWVRKLEGGASVEFWIESQSAAVERDGLLGIRGVASVAVPQRLHPLVDAQPRSIEIGPARIARGAPATVIAGPCSVESKAQILAIAERVAALGVGLLRGGAYKPRTSPYAFQGHGERALGWMREAADRFGLGVVTELLDQASAASVGAHADLIQIGSRSMQSFPLLRAAAELKKPILLKRGMSATVEEWLLSAEHCLVHGAPAVIFCERGIRGFDQNTRNLLDLGAVALLSEVHGLPVIVDPSHALGRRDLIPALSRAALAAGAVGLMLETHDQPGVALSDGPQALPPSELDALLRGLGLAATGKR